MATGFKSWSTTAADNDDADSAISWLEGMAPSGVNDSSRAVMSVLASWRDNIGFGTVSGGTVGGTGNAVTLTLSPTIEARTAGRRYLFKAGAACTGAVTLTVDSTTQGAIQWRGSALVSGDIAQNDWILVADDATNFQMLTPPRVSVVATQTQMEAGSSTAVYVTPGRQHNHSSAVKAWINFVPRGTNGACTVNASYNCDGASRTAAGTYVITLTTDMSSVNYCVVANSESSGALNLMNIITAKAAGTCTLHQISASAGTESDLGDAIHVVFLGDQ